MPSAAFSQKKQNCIVTVKLDSCVLFDQFFLYEVNHIFLASVFGSLHTTEYTQFSINYLRIIEIYDKLLFEKVYNHFHKIILQQRDSKINTNNK